MSRVIVEIENPKGCDSCPLMDATPAGDYSDSEYVCIPTEHNLDPATVCANNKPWWCPMRPAPDCMASWVPCSVRQPTVSKYYIATVIKTASSIPDPLTERIWYSVEDGGWSFPNDSASRFVEEYMMEVVAWMEIPEPYNPNGIYDYRRWENG